MPDRFLRQRIASRDRDTPASTFPVQNGRQSRPRRRKSRGRRVESQSSVQLRISSFSIRTFLSQVLNREICSDSVTPFYRAVNDQPTNNELIPIEICLKQRLLSDVFRRVAN